MRDQGGEVTKYAPVPGKIPGRPLNLGGREFVLPPLNLDGVQAYLALQGEFAAIKDDLPALYALVAKIMHLALVRNYPDLTPEDIAALLDMGTVMSAPRALAEVSGLQSAGEPMPATQ